MSITTLLPTLAQREDEMRQGASLFCVALLDVKERSLWRESHSSWEK